MSDANDEECVWRCRRRQALNAVAWKNGGGVTRELARGGSGGALEWRLSIAELTRPGPFSSFAGWQRVFGVMGRRPVTLVFGETRHTLGHGETLTFPGDAPLECELPDGTSQALNLMFDPKGWHGTMVGPDLIVREVERCQHAWLVLTQGLASVAGIAPLAPGDSLHWSADDIAAGPACWQGALAALSGARGFAVRLSRGPSGNWG